MQWERKVKVLGCRLMVTRGFGEQCVIFVHALRLLLVYCAMCVFRKGRNTSICDSPTGSPRGLTVEAGTLFIPHLFVEIIKAINKGKMYRRVIQSETVFHQTFQYHSWIFHNVIFHSVTAQAIAVLYTLTFCAASWIYCKSKYVFSDNEYEALVMTQENK